MDDIRLGSRTLQPRRQLLADGRRKPLGKRALDILSVLAEARGGIVTKDELLEAVWPGVTVEENALQVHIVALRKALGPEADRLRTIRGIGYQLDVDGAAEPHAAPPGDGAREQEQRAAMPAAARPARPVTAWSGLRRFRAMAVGIAVLAVLFAAWMLVGPKLGIGARERIPVVVRTLTASGSGDPTEAALANGITDELIDRLRRIPELRVATVEAGREVDNSRFRNAYVVDGSIRRDGDQLRVMTRLADANGEILWSQTFDRRLIELLDMQERIASSIADALSVSFDVGADSTAYGGTDNPEAYAALLEANANGRNPDQSVRLRHLERALALDPDYIQALVALSIYYDTQVNIVTGVTRQQALAHLAKADDFSARALTANPNLWAGHFARVWYNSTRKDFSAAERGVQRMVELDRGDDPRLLQALASNAFFVGRTNKALALVASAETIEPARRFDGREVDKLLVGGRYREAIDVAKELSVGDPLVNQRLFDRVVWSYFALGQEADALRYAEQHDPSWAEAFRAFRANTALPAMSPAQLRRWADGRYGEGGQMPVANDALFAAYSGNPELAAELLQVALERPGALAVSQLWHPMLAETRQTDGFEKLVADIGLVKMWRESGDWGDYCRPVSATEISCH